MKQLILLTIDFTSLFYVTALLAYIVVAIYLEGNIAFNLQERMLQIEPIAVQSFWYLVTIIPVARLIQAFQFPGVMFSSAEYQLSILPYSRTEIWFMLALERWLKATVIYAILASIVYLITPISLTVILAYVGVLLLLNIAMTTVEWKFFQLPILLKIAAIIMLLVFNAISIFTVPAVIASGFIGFLLIINIILARKLFKQIDWQKVTAACDYKLWNMKMISYATKIKYKKDRKYSMWQRMNFWKKPFPYKKPTLYHRLWHIYLEKNGGLILQLMGALLLMLVVLSFLPTWLFLLAIVITISSYTTFAAALFKDRLSSDIVQVLPWDLNIFKEIYETWVLVSGITFVIPIIIKTSLGFTLWTIAQWIVIIFTYYLVLDVKLQKIVTSFDSSCRSSERLHLIGYIFFLIIIFGETYKVLLIVGCLIAAIALFYLRMQKKVKA